MPDEDKAEAARQWFALLDAQRIDELCAMTAATWRLHGGPPDVPSGRDGLRAVVPLISPLERTWVIEDVRGVGDCVLVHATHAELQETFLGPSGGGRWQMFPATFIHRIAGGLILETWRPADEESWILELGTPAAWAVPPPGRPLRVHATEAGRPGVWTP
jgi:hypothetical protein